MTKRAIQTLENPYRPGAGHMPPYLAGREKETDEFERLLKQTTILSNLVLTGLRGTGKTVLLETFRPIAVRGGWFWVGSDLSESASVSEQSMAIRLMTDLSVVTSSVITATRRERQIGFGGRSKKTHQTMDYLALLETYDATPGLVSDKLKNVLEISWANLSRLDCRGLIFAYDEAQNLADGLTAGEYPLSLLLDVFQSIQKKGVPFLLALVGLPTLHTQLVNARTYSERMFRVLFLDRLSNEASREAILKPLESMEHSIPFTPKAIKSTIENSGGYPFFIQFICREAYDLALQKLAAGKPPKLSIDEILRKLDSDFFAARWSRATDRQRELLSVAARIEGSETEFTIQQLVEHSKKELAKPFSASHANQMLVSLCEAGLVYKNRRGKYSFAVPLLNRFIIRQMKQRK
jgi:AAA+ ATPase superfamily predicted ATPase